MIDFYDYKTKKFIRTAMRIHGRKYNYGNTVYVKSSKKVSIVCRKHGSFNQTPHNHLQGNGCPKCSNTSLSDRKLSFIAGASVIHNSKYSYDDVVYVNNRVKVSICCPEHGKFTQSPNSHLRGSGCPLCNTSKNEVRLIRFITDLGFVAKSQIRFSGCRDRYSLPFDVGVYSKDGQLIGLVEYQGVHHYVATSYTNDRQRNIQNFERIQRHDQIKRDFCLANKISLLEIPYTCSSQSESLLTKFLFQ